MTALALGFDVYGTLVDPLEMATRLQGMVGDRAPEMARVWREKQLEYSFRRGLMQCYADFSVCTQEALEYAMNLLALPLSLDQQQQLLEGYQQLSPFADVIPALARLGKQGHRMAAFSNGEPTRVTSLLTHAGVLPSLDKVISVDALKTFKPDPRVYHHLSASLAATPATTWLVSSNPFDVIGAKAAGIKAAWVKRSPQAQFDPWGGKPDLVVADLNELADALSEGAVR